MDPGHPQHIARPCECITVCPVPTLTQRPENPLFSLSTSPSPTQAQGYILGEVVYA
jgi:hypothetical protein